MTRRCLRFAFASVALAMANSVTAAPHRADTGPSAPDLAALDGFAQGMSQAGGFSGVVLVARGDAILSEKAYGKIDEKRDAPATIDTRYNLASAGKMFATVAVLQQIAAG